MKSIRKSKKLFKKSLQFYKLMLLREIISCYRTAARSKYKCVAHQRNKRNSLKELSSLLNKSQLKFWKQLLNKPGYIN